MSDFLAKHADDVEVIFHMGAISATTESNVDKIIRNNFKLTTWLWQWCAVHDVRLICASSAATYGDGANGFEDLFEGKNLSKLQPLNACEP